MDLVTLVGLVAATCTTASYWPQLKKCWDTGSASDLSFKMFAILALGIACWVVYGVLKADYVIILANSISLFLLCGILYFKVREGTFEPQSQEHKVDCQVSWPSSGELKSRLRTF